MNNDRVQLEHVFGNVEHQREAAEIFKEALSIKTKIVDLIIHTYGINTSKIYISSDYEVTFLDPKSFLFFYFRNSVLYVFSQIFVV